LARLAVFAGGCTLDGAEKVAEADVDTLQSLVEKSLLRHTRERYWMLETVREYATERLDELRERDELHHRLAEYLIEFVERSDMTPAERTRLVPLLNEELDNLRAAVAFLLETHHIRLALRLANRAHLFNVTPAEPVGAVEFLHPHAFRRSRELARPRRRDRLGQQRQSPLVGSRADTRRRADCGRVAAAALIMTTAVLFGHGNEFGGSGCTRLSHSTRSPGSATTIGCAERRRSGSTTADPSLSHVDDRGPRRASSET
jgi:hypothetical protein